MPAPRMRPGTFSTTTMKTATIYTAATLLLAAIVLAVVCAVLKEEPTGGLKTKAEDRQAALDEATNLMLGR